MAKRPPSTAVLREQTLAVKLSAPEYQLLAYAASKSNVRGVGAWVREKALAAARERLSDKVVAEIMSGRATAALLRESLKDTRKAARVVPFNGKRKPI